MKEVKARSRRGRVYTPAQVFLRLCEPEPAGRPHGEAPLLLCGSGVGDLVEAFPLREGILRLGDGRVLDDRVVGAEGLRTRHEDQERTGSTQEHLTVEYSKSTSPIPCMAKTPISLVGHLSKLPHRDPNPWNPPNYA